MAPDFSIILNGITTSINLYSFDTGSDIFLGQDFLRRHLPLVVEASHIGLNIQRRTVKISSNSSYVNRIVDPSPYIVEYSLEKLENINKVIRNAKTQGPTYIKGIKGKIEAECTVDAPNVFWKREKYFLDLPYKENHS